MENLYHIDNGNQSKQQSFDYAALDVEAQIAVQKHTCDIKRMMRRTTQDIIEIGEKLIEVKQYLGFGHFSNWLIAEFGWKERTARNFMRVAEVFKSAKFADLFIASSALYHLAAPSTPESARQEALELANKGEYITYSKARSIISQHQELKKLKNSTCNVTSDANKHEVDSVQAKLITSVEEVFHESLPDSQTVDVLAVVIDRDGLGSQKVSAENPSSTNPISIRISDDCRALIKSVESLREEEATALVRAIAKHWSVEKILEKIKK
ncbi:DUF3102 domain-containing protein [Scytonema millei]|uniref:DUF3102 domain-containing protein n=1 Tax=Scytonema millei VB511283 TaxID=1245923 RepID=A0A9X5EA78_9CYAN|nr:DUF3102 domain-containing protein [Scytonema millei]NHC38004.1 DUF3102 domain-containing protein [Scytonema millei VB511283]